MSFGDVYSTTVNVNGSTVFRSRYSPCCCNYSMFSSPMMSCFGFGYGGYGMGCFGFGSFGAGLGAGVGFAAGTAIAGNFPNIFKGIGKGLSWVGTNVIAPAATFTWNNVLKPVGNAIWSGAKWAGKTVAKGAEWVGKNVWSGIKWVGNTIAKGAKAVANGIASLFRKKS